MSAKEGHFHRRSNSLLQRLASLTLRAWIFLLFSMNDAFTLPLRLAVGDCRKSFLPLDLHCSSGLQAPFRRERNQLSKRSIVTPDSARELRRPPGQVFGRNQSQYTTRTIASPQPAFFPWQLGVRKFTYLPDCLIFTFLYYLNLSLNLA